jgi:hypothetical protein
MSSIFLLAALLAADDPPARLKDETSASLPLYRYQGESFRLGVTLAAQARVSLPFGAADEGDIFVVGNTVFIEGHLDYSELFEPGYGFTLEADLMARPRLDPDVDPRLQPLAMGGFVALGWDRFGGETTRDETGTRVSPEALEVGTVFVGVKADGVVQGNFYGDLRFGMGAVHYPSLDARFEPGGRGELFSESWEFAMEIRGHFGWRFGPLGLVFGMGGRLMAPPENGRESNLDPGILWTLDFELGAELGF